MSLKKGTDSEPPKIPTSIQLSFGIIFFQFPPEKIAFSEFLCCHIFLFVFCFKLIVWCDLHQDGPLRTSFILLSLCWFIYGKTLALGCAGVAGLSRGCSSVYALLRAC